MDNNDVQLVGGPCGQHGPYTFYKAFKYTKNDVKRIVTLSEFFFVKMWRDSDLLCIGELQLLWIDKNSEQVLASLRLYFLPENTPEGRLDHGEDEVLAISEKVVIRVEDLITWITVEAEWTWGRLAKCEDDLKNVEFDSSDCVPPRKPTGTSFTLTDSTLDFGDVENERKTLESSNDSGPHVIILSFPKYCRYRAMMKRLEDVENLYLKYKIVNALGGFYVLNPNTRVLFCKDTFDYPELEGHELLCNHLAPKLKGRPRGKRKKRSVSPCSESNESESSVSNSYNTRADHKNGYRNDSGITPRRSTRCHENNENKEFVRKLTAFMKANHTPIGRIPSLGYKELNLHEFFTKVQKLGGYDSVTTNRLWKSIFDDMSGHQNSTSAATVIRRHYERFLLPYERHVKGEEYKPLPVSERRRLKSKRGSSSISDAESNSGDSIPIPSTSRKTSLSASSTESNPKTEGKPSSLRSVRVKPERQKDKQAEGEKISENNNNNSIEKQKEDDDKSEVKPKVEKLIIKTESMTLTTECTVKVESTPVKIENAIEKAECNTIKSESQIKPEAVPIEMKAEIIPIKSEIIPIITEVKADVSSTKAEILPIEPITKEEIKTEVISVKPENPKLPEKLVEPLTSAATPVAQKVPPEKISSPVEGKENIPIIKTGDTATKNSSDIMDVPYKPKPTETSVESEPYKSTFIHEVKKRKLDILKEGGLEVTPVRPPMINPIKDSRPSVIQQITPPAQIISKAKAAEIMPPPPINSVPSKRMHISVSPAVNIGQVKVAPSTPIKPARVSPTTNSFSYMNGSTPPRVVQSKSIYSYSEKTVYGNPKDILSPTIKNIVYTPKFIGGIPRQSGGDPVDLSVNSPQKPIVEIMRIPQTSSSSFQSPYNRDTVTKNLYKTSPSIMDGRRLGPNLEITLVGPNSNKSSVPNLKPFSFPSTQVSSPHTSSQYAAPKRFAPDYYAPNKMAKSDENGRYGKLVVPHPPRDHKHNVDNINIPNPFTNKTSVKHDQSRRLPSAQSPVKPFPSPSMQGFSPYFSQLYEGNKGIPPYLPLLDHTMYYTAAMQSLYSSAALNSAPPILPLPTPEQLKFYTELMARGRLNFPFQVPQDGNPSMVNSNNFKKP